jgi:hypothetical protein
MDEWAAAIDANDVPAAVLAGEPLLTERGNLPWDATRHLEQASDSTFRAIVEAMDLRLESLFNDAGSPCRALCCCDGELAEWLTARFALPADDVDGLDALGRAVVDGDPVRYRWIRHHRRIPRPAMDAMLRRFGWALPRAAAGNGMLAALGMTNEQLLAACRVAKNAGHNDAAIALFMECSFEVGPDQAAMVQGFSKMLSKVVR